MRHLRKPAIVLLLAGLAGALIVTGLRLRSDYQKIKRAAARPSGPEVRFVPLTRDPRP